MMMMVEDFYGFLSEDEGEIVVSSCTDSGDNSSSSGSSSDTDDVDTVQMPSNSPHPSPPPERRKNSNDQKQKKMEYPPGFHKQKWSRGDNENMLEPLPAFDEYVGMNFDVPDEANELYFFKLFISDEVIKDITDQTNLYAKQYFETNEEIFNQVPGCGCSLLKKACRKIV